MHSQGYRMPAAACRECNEAAPQFQAIQSMTSEYLHKNLPPVGSILKILLVL